MPRYTNRNGICYYFGSYQGSFTGAYADNIGAIESANNGVLLLENFGKLNAEGQSVVMQFLDNGVVQRMTIITKDA